IRAEVTNLRGIAARCWERKLKPPLERAGVTILPYDSLSEQQRRRAVSFFNDTVFPVLTPLAFDPGRPFPHISNLSLNLAVLIRDASGEEHFARVKVPDSLPALVPLTRPPKSAAKRNRTRSQESYVGLEEVIAANLA